MADEIDITSNEVSSTEAPTKVKKTRGPRKPRTVPEAADTPSVSSSVKRTRGPGRKRKDDTAANAAATKTTATTGKAARGKRLSKGSRDGAAASVAMDEFQDLMKLEEENQQLRKALSAKLRAENADLRRKLGAG